MNNTGYTVVRFYGFNKGPTRGRRSSARPVLESGQSVIVSFNDATGYCKLDFRAVFNDDDEVVQPDVNVCETGTFTFN